MASEFETFLAISESVHAAEIFGIKSGKRMGTLQDIGIFLGEDSPAHIRNAKICELLSEEEWEKRALTMHQGQKTLGAKPEDSKPTINPVNITR
jgi:hypothetical protein